MLHHPFERLSEGDRFTSRGRTVTEGDVHAFAAQTGDLHPQHTDADWASRSPFGERIAHGMLVMSYAVGLVGFDPERVMALRRISDAVFKRPVKFGDSIHVEGSIAALNPISDEAGLVTITLRILNQHGQTVCRAKVEALWRRDDAPAPDALAPSDSGFVPIPF
jgi:acyl dehydratase